MNTYVTEQQQIEQFRQWWKKHGASTIIIFLLALIVSFGWRYWQQHREQVLEQASQNYEQLLNSVVNDKAAVATQQANALMANYARTPYAPLAALMLARQSVYQGNYTDAENRLMWVVNHARSKPLRQVARIRAARVLLAQNQPAQALVLLNDIDDSTYTAEIDEIRGDCYVALGQLDQARMSYLQATTVLPGYDVAQPLLRMKLDDLASSNDASLTSTTPTTATAITSTSTPTPTTSTNSSATTPTTTTVGASS